MDKRLLNIKEISEFLGVSVNTVYSWVSHGTIPFVKCGHLTRFDILKIEQWLSKNSYGGDIKRKRKLDFYIKTNIMMKGETTGDIQ